MARTSQLPGFRKITVEELPSLVADATGVNADEMADALEHGGLVAESADKFVENVLGTYALPYGVALNVRVNGHDHVVPMVTEEPSVVAAASNAAKMVRSSGGFVAEVDPPLMVAQIQLTEVRDAELAARQDIGEHANEIMKLAERAISGLLARGGGVRAVEPRSSREDMVVVHVVIDCKDAMGANLVNTVAEAVGLASLRSPTLVSVCAFSRIWRTSAAFAFGVTWRPTSSPPTRWPETRSSTGWWPRLDSPIVDPYRAATHNKGIKNGI